ncbi:MAG: histidine phosphatase family protein [Luminiphilus sp.]|nr:histidine phosphatase family protein [Luminiphilus sp.]
MKRLYLLRHAKSSWKNPELSDRERPLNKRGYRDAPRMGAYLSERYSPPPFFVSPACRAQETYTELLTGWPDLNSQTVTTEEALYTFEFRELLQWLSACPDELASIAVVGHNPALTDLTNWLLGAEAIENLPTAGWVDLVIDLDRWANIELSRGKGRCKTIIRPKDID